ncbi:hypothetical protein VNO80_23036 [Phaseolus coccineus]|uniref:Pentatricopeptide repeat-containing protein n=1 Tax=Phaseolus coccineus TaxID=3886 RepID=A0AAN9MB02_PHACN
MSRTMNAVCLGAGLGALKFISEDKPEPSLVNVVHVERVKFALSFAVMCKNKIISGRKSMSCSVALFSIKAAIDSNCFVGTALLHVYAKCSSIKYASQIFDSMPEKNECGLHGLMGSKQDPFMISSAVSACAGLTTLVEGKQLHAISHNSGFRPNIYVSSSLTDMYAKCGCIREAYLVFQGVMEVWSFVLLNAMIYGFARHNICINTKCMHAVIWVCMKKNRKIFDVLA